MLNIQRQQQQQPQEIRVTSLSPANVAKNHASVKEGERTSIIAQRSDGVDIHEPSEGPMSDAENAQHAKDSVISCSLAKSRTRGISSLLMPPSIRRKLEAVAEVQRQTDHTTDDTMRYFLFDATHQSSTLPDFSLLNPNTLVRPGRSYDPGSFDSQFTARTEKPLHHTHLRELYKVEQEMHDMSDALSSISFSNSTMSEVDELEVLPYDSG